MSAAGWVRLHRQLAEHPIWTQERFTRGQAWVDLIMLASYQEHIVIHGNRPLTVQRGQVLTSQVKLAARWKWNRKTVAGFMISLRKAKMVDIVTSKETDTGYTLITLCNYGRFQDTANTGADIENGATLDIGADIERTSSGHQVPTINKGKKGKNLADADASAGGGALSPDSTKRRRAAPADPNVKVVLDAYHDAFRDKYGSPPPLNGGKCGAIARQLLRGRPVAEAVWLVREFLDAPPQFYADKNLCGMEHVLAAAPTLLARKATEGRP